MGLLIQNQTFNAPKTDHDKLRELIEAVLAKQRAGVKVRVIFRLHDFAITDVRRNPKSTCRLPTTQGWCRDGRWKAVGGNIIRVRFDDPEAEPYTLRVVSVEEGVLRIRR